MDLKAKFGYGDTVMDKLSGFEGRVTAVCFYQTGCIQYCVNAGKLKESGTPLDGEWFDVSRLKSVPVKARVVRNPTGRRVMPISGELEQEIQELVARELRRQLADKGSGGPQFNPPAAN